MKTAMFALLVGLFVLTSCAFNRKNDAFLQVQPGMDQAQVQSLLGQPIDRKFIADHDEWTYREEMGKGIYKTKVIVFDNRKVVAMADDAVAAEREYEKSKARATASQTPQPGAQPPATAQPGTLPPPPVAQGPAANPSTGTSSAAPAQPPAAVQPAPPPKAMKKTRNHIQHHPITEPPTDRDDK